jgi:hypothetical protein
MRSEIIRPYLEKLIGQWLEVPVLATDDEGRYHVRVATSGFIVEIVDFEPTLVRVWSPVVVGLEKSLELLETLNGLNGKGLGLRVFHLDDKVILATELVAETLDAQELDFTCHLLAGAAEQLGPELVGLYGGSTLFEPRSDITDGGGDVPSSRLLTTGGYL